MLLDSVERLRALGGLRILLEEVDEVDDELGLVGNGGFGAVEGHLHRGDHVGQGRRASESGTGLAAAPAPIAADHASLGKGPGFELL